MEILEVLQGKAWSILREFAVIAAIALATVELATRCYPWKDDGQKKRVLFWLVLVLGPAFGGLGFWFELVDVPLHGVDLSELSTTEHQARHLFGAMFLGFGATVIGRCVSSFGLARFRKAGGKDG